MKMIRPIFFLMVLGCTSSKPDKVVTDSGAYALEIDEWHKRRVESLRGPNGWLNVAGLFWLKEGINTFGSGGQNDIVFPNGKIEEQAGLFVLQKDRVTMEAAAAAKIVSGGMPIKRMILFQPDSLKVPVAESGTLQWFVIKRDAKYGIRLRDLTNVELEKFTQIERYPVNSDWKFEARFERADSSRTIDITNILGQTTPQRSPGTVVFKIDEKEYKLDALDEGGEEYFMIFGDATNAKDTYGAGRYLYIKKPGEDGRTFIDFNKAYNPPCAFTAFAPCPLPPKQNVLSVEIPAGEKNYTYQH